MAATSSRVQNFWWVIFRGNMGSTMKIKKIINQPGHLGYPSFNTCACDFSTSNWVGELI